VEALTPQARILYNGRDITADLSPYLMRVSYTDRLTGEADSLDVELAETDAVTSRWLSEWYPDKGMVMSAEIGYAGQALMACGSFDVDEIEVETPPMSIRIRARCAPASAANTSTPRSPLSSTRWRGALARSARARWPRSKSIA
jgi:phage protein D